MRSTYLKNAIRDNKTVYGMMLSELAVPNVMRIVKNAGIEYVIIDCEHGYADFPQVAGLVAIANLVQLPVLIRIPEIRRELILKYLDIGADGLLVPMVETKEQAEQVLKYAKYMPKGERGVAFSRGHTGFTAPSIAPYFEEANAETLIMVQLETRKGIANAQEIASVEGLDAVIIGPADLSCDCGIPGKFHEDEMIGHYKAAIEAAKSEGKACGIIAGDNKLLVKCKDLGMSVFAGTNDVAALTKGVKTDIAAFYSAIEEA